MKLYTSIFTTIAIAVASFFGYVPKQEIFVLNNRLDAIEKTVNGDSNVLGAYSTTGGDTYRLRSYINASATELNLSSFKEPVSNIPYTMTYLNTSVGYITIEPQTPRSEFASFTGITQNTDGTAKLTGVTRGLTRTPQASACTASTTLAQGHQAQSVVVISDSPCHFAEYAVKRNDETVSGQWAFPYPSASSSVATKGYVDTLALGGNPNVDRLLVAGTAGETVSGGQILYLKQSDARWYKASISTSEASSTILGIAQGSGTAGVSISGGVLLHGLDSFNIGLTAGAPYFLSATAGATSTASSTRPIGRARNTTSLYFDTQRNLLTSDNTFYGSNTFSSTTNLTASTTLAGITLSNPSQIYGSGIIPPIGWTLLVATTSEQALTNFFIPNIPERHFLKIYMFVQAPGDSGSPPEVTFNSTTTSSGLIPTNAVSYSYNYASTTVASGNDFGNRTYRIPLARLTDSTTRTRPVFAEMSIFDNGTFANSSTTKYFTNNIMVIGSGLDGGGIPHVLQNQVGSFATSTSGYINRMLITDGGQTISAGSSVYIFGSSF